ncbi:Hypothetical protein A7982_03925 [Minicystis rosea]|nr:Hypothetical protein A7982_03925 [Minicystis rosea]
MNSPHETPSREFDKNTKTNAGTRASNELDGRWTGTFAGAARGLEVVLVASGGQLTGRAWTGALTDKPKGGVIAGTLGADGSVHFTLRARGASPDAAPLAAFEGALTGGELRGRVDGEAVSLRRAESEVADTITWCNVTFNNYQTFWYVKFDNRSSTCTWYIESGPPFHAGTSGNADIHGFLLWPSWYEAEDVPPVHDPYGPCFQFEWQDTANPGR